jgi:hypothetical protein
MQRPRCCRRRPSLTHPGSRKKLQQLRSHGLDARGMNGAVPAHGYASALSQSPWRMKRGCITRLSSGLSQLLDLPSRTSNAGRRGRTGPQLFPLHFGRVGRRSGVGFAKKGQDAKTIWMPRPGAKPLAEGHSGWFRCLLGRRKAKGPASWTPGSPGHFVSCVFSCPASFSGDCLRRP